MNKNIEPFNDKDQPHGLWELYWNDGQLCYKCVYINGVKNGFDECYYYYGEIIYKNYHL